MLEAVPVTKGYIKASRGCMVVRGREMKGKGQVQLLCEKK
jgi:hypothetical protein